MFGIVTMAGERLVFHSISSVIEAMTNAHST